MREDLVTLVKAISLAQKRGCYSLEESAIIYQCIKGINTCPACNPPQKEDTDIVMLDVDDEKLDTIPE